MPPARRVCPESFAFRRSCRSVCLVSLLAASFSFGCDDKSDGIDEDPAEAEETAAAEEATEADEAGPTETEPSDESDELSESEEQNFAEDTEDDENDGRRGAAHILVRFQGAERASENERTKDAAEARARTALGQAQAADFGAAAQEFSDDAANSGQGGDLGRVEQGLLPAPLDRALFEMEVGDVRGPIESPFGFHVLKRTS